MLLMWKWMGLFLRKKYLLRCWGWLSLLIALGLLLPQRRLELWFLLWSFFLLRLLCISTNLPYGCAWNTGAPSCYLELLDKLLKRICRIVVLSLCASLETLAPPQKVGSFSLFYKYCFGRCCLNFSSNCMPCSGCPVLYEVNPNKKSTSNYKNIKIRPSVLLSSSLAEGSSI